MTTDMNKTDYLNLLQRLDPDEPDATQTQLASMVETLNANPLPSEQHLEVLETARTLIASVQTQLARRYAAFPAAPKSDESRMLKRVQRLWKDLYTGYMLIARHPVSGAGKDVRALTSQRRMHALCQIMIEYFRAHRAIPPDTWLTMHQYYLSVERSRTARVRVSDPLNEFWKAQSPLEAYLALLLVDIANPYGRNENEFSLLPLWARRFAPYCMLYDKVDARQAASYSLDLMMDEGLRPLGSQPASAGLRYFDGSKLGEHIREAIVQIKRGKSTTALGLGSASAAECIRLLRSLYRPWGRQRHANAFRATGVKAASSRFATTGPRLRCASREKHLRSQRRTRMFRITSTIWRC